MSRPVPSHAFHYEHAIVARSLAKMAYTHEFTHAPSLHARHLHTRSYTRAISAKTRNTSVVDAIVDAIVHARHLSTRSFNPREPRARTSSSHVIRTLLHPYTSFVHARHLHTRSYTRALITRHLHTPSYTRAIFTRHLHPRHLHPPSYTRAIFTRDPPRTRGTRTRHPKTAIPHAIRIYHHNQLFARHPLRVSGFLRDKTKNRVANP
jgi:hypothetical protein